MSPLEVGPTPLALTAAANIRIKDTRAKKKTVRSLRHDRTGSTTMLPWSRRRSRLSGSLETLEDAHLLTHPRADPEAHQNRPQIPDHPGSSRIIPDHPGSSRNFHRLSSEYRTSPVFRGRTPHVPCFSPQNRLGRRNLPTSKGSFSRRITGHSCTVCRRAPNRGESRVRKTTSAQYRPQWVSVNASATPSPRKM